jgi:putative ABC transport system permease protein
VAGHVEHWQVDGRDGHSGNEIYASLNQLRDEWVPGFRTEMALVARTPLPAAAILPGIREAVRGEAGDQPIYDVRTMREIVANSMSKQRLPMVLLAAFAGLALLLAAAGLYGVISYSVTQRVREIGIRMALGAVKRDVFVMVVGQGVRLALVGLALGTIAALAMSRLLSNFSRLLYDVGTADPLTLTGTAVVLLATAILACYFPAHRAVRLDPNIALRHE